jgi:hypothetical protein
VRAYLSRIEGETRERLAASGRVSEMIAAAINVDPRWFWHGPDA